MSKLFQRIFGKVAGAFRKQPQMAVSDDAGAAPGIWYPVESSNVAAIKWQVGKAIYKGKDTQLQRSSEFVDLESGAIPVSTQMPKERKILQYASVIGHEGAGQVGGKSLTPQTVGTLSVRFKSGWEYEYYDIQKAMFDDFLQAPSKGKYVRQWLWTTHRYRRVR